MATRTAVGTPPAPPALRDVRARAQQFRRLLEQLSQPGGLTRERVGELGRWLDGPVWRLLDDHEQALAELAR